MQRSQQKYEGVRTTHVSVVADLLLFNGITIVADATATHARTSVVFVIHSPE
jgi:hypothetical protein